MKKLIVFASLVVAVLGGSFAVYAANGTQEKPAPVYYLPPNGSIEAPAGWSVQNTKETVTTEAQAKDLLKKFLYDLNSYVLYRKDELKNKPGVWDAFLSTRSANPEIYKALAKPVAGIQGGEIDMTLLADLTSIMNAKKDVKAGEYARQILSDWHAYYFPGEKHGDYYGAASVDRTRANDAKITEIQTYIQANK